MSKVVNGVKLNNEEYDLYLKIRPYQDEVLLSWCGYKDILQFENDAEDNYSKALLVLLNFEDLVDNFAEMNKTTNINESVNWKTSDDQLFGSSHPNFAGNFEVKSWNKNKTKNISTGVLFNLDSFDKELIAKNGITLTPNERVYRYQTETTKSGGMKPLIKINIQSGKLYFIQQRDDEIIRFDNRGLDSQFINLLEEKQITESDSSIVVTADAENLKDVATKLKDVGKDIIINVNEMTKDFGSATITNNDGKLYSNFQDYPDVTNFIDQFNKNNSILSAWNKINTKEEQYVALAYLITKLNIQPQVADRFKHILNSVSSSQPKTEHINPRMKKGELIKLINETAKKL
jgi:hypothetical protein